MFSLPLNLNKVCNFSFFLGKCGMEVLLSVYFYIYNETLLIFLLYSGYFNLLFVVTSGFLKFEAEKLKQDPDRIFGSHILRITYYGTKNVKKFTEKQITIIFIRNKLPNVNVKAKNCYILTTVTFYQHDYHVRNFINRHDHIDKRN